MSRWLALGLALLLGGCGFRPVYMPTASGKAGPAQRELAAVYVPIIPERPGQLLRQALRAHLGDESGTPSQYDLQVSYGIYGEGISIQTNSIATRIRFTGNASWTLVAHDGKHTALTSGLARSMDGLNVFDSQFFASDLETEAIQARIAENIAQQITTQLAIYFRNHADG